jgi:hypothetical protein
MRVAQLEKLSGVPRQTLQQGKNGGILPKLVREGWLERIGRSQYSVPDAILLQTTASGLNGEVSTVAKFEAALREACKELNAINAEERRARKSRTR